MNEVNRGIVVAHGSLAQALVEEAERITGRRGMLHAVSNSGGDRAEIERRARAVADLLVPGLAAPIRPRTLTQRRTHHPRRIP